MSRAGIRVSLDGHGGDELLAGYPDQVRLARDEALSPIPKLRRAVGLTAMLRRMDSEEAGRATGRDWADCGRTYARRLKSRFIHRRGAAEGIRRGPFSEWLCVSPLADADVADSVPPEGMLAPLAAKLYQDFHSRALPTILRDFDRFSMAHGVEVRSPFLDFRLVCYCLSLPSETVLAAHENKRVLREAMRGQLPEAIRTRGRKIPYKSPLLEWWRGSFREFVLDTVASAAFLESAVWDGPAIRRFVEGEAEAGRIKNALLGMRFVVAHRLIGLFQSARARHLAAANQ
jgi:asparagine synthase (glutamine-hydrolysing)